MKGERERETWRKRLQQWRCSRKMPGAMIVFSESGPVSINPDDVLCVYRGGGDGRYTYCTLVMRGGSEISGAISNAALDALEAKLDAGLPPQAA